MIKIMAKEYLSVKVTHIAGKWHCRLLRNGVVIDENCCESRLLIGLTCRSMLRWHDKYVGDSMFASAARHRQGIKDIKESAKNIQL